MSEPDEFIVNNTNKRCRGCGVHNSGLRRTAFKYEFNETKFLTAWICAKCTTNCKLVPSLIRFRCSKRLSCTFFSAKYKNSISIFHEYFLLNKLGCNWLGLEFLFLGAAKP